MHRPGLQKDFKCIASLSATDFLLAVAPSDPARGAGMGGADTPAARQAIATARRHLQFSTAHVPLTDGHKMQLRHVGHAMNLLWGPLNQFSTHNFPDTYSPMMKLLHDAERGLPRQEEPTMPTLQEMHKKCAASPASSSDFWLLRIEWHAGTFMASTQ